MPQNPDLKRQSARPRVPAEGVVIEEAGQPISEQEKKEVNKRWARIMEKARKIAALGYNKLMEFFGLVEQAEDEVLKVEQAEDKVLEDAQAPDQPDLQVLPGGLNEEETDEDLETTVREIEAADNEPNAEEITKQDQYTDTSSEIRLSSERIEKPLQDYMRNLESHKEIRGEDAGPVIMEPGSSIAIAGNNYEVIGLLGSGGFGSVFSVRDKSGQIFAVKLVEFKGNLEEDLRRRSEYVRVGRESMINSYLSSGQIFNETERRGIISSLREKIAESHPEYSEKALADTESTVLKLLECEDETEKERILQAHEAKYPHTRVLVRRYADAESGRTRKVTGVPEAHESQIIKSDINAVSNEGINFVWDYYDELTGIQRVTESRSSEKNDAIIAKTVATQVYKALSREGINPRSLTKEVFRDYLNSINDLSSKVASGVIEADKEKDPIKKVLYSKEIINAIKEQLKSYTLGTEVRVTQIAMLMENVSAENKDREKNEKIQNLEEIEDHLNLEQRLRATMGMMLGLRRIHQRHIAHRDIKPANVMVDPKNMDARILDTGLAETFQLLLPEDRNYNTGTFRYMPPEALAQDAKKDISEDDFLKRDIYSLGITMYRLFFGSDNLYDSSGKKPQEQRKGTDSKIAQVSIEQVKKYIVEHGSILKRKCEPKALEVDPSSPEGKIAVLIARMIGPVESRPNIDDVAREFYAIYAPYRSEQIAAREAQNEESRKRQESQQQSEEARRQRAQEQ
ncbi:MAG: protein kinase [Patescibacteria group bacterium]|jgi:serine/threonine protein kinase